MRNGGISETFIFLYPILVLYKTLEDTDEFDIVTARAHNLSSSTLPLSIEQIHVYVAV